MSGFVQSGHRQRKNFPNPHEIGKSGDFLFGDDALHGKPQSGRLQKVLRKTCEVRQGSEGARSDHVKRGKTQILHPCVMRAKVLEAQLNLRLLQKGDFFFTVSTA